MERVDAGDGPADETPRLLGIDVGGSALKLALCAPDGTVLFQAAAPAQGRPAAVLADLLAHVQPAPGQPTPVRVAITGSAEGLSRLFPCIFANEVVATARAVHERYPAARTVIDLGGHFSKWILLGGDAAQPGTVVDFAANGLCAAGAGAFLEQQASRLGLSVDALGQLAAGAARGASIAGRCSVFAKSDMIHLQQKGTPPGEIAYGLCLALVRTFLATVVGGRTLTPAVVLVGGGACNPGLVRAFREILKSSERDLFAAGDAVFLGARGVARMALTAPITHLSYVVQQVARAARHDAPIASCGPVETVRPREAAALFRPPRHATSQLPPLGPPTSSAPTQPPEDPIPMRGTVRAFLGVDVGSVSTNLVLLGRSLELIQGIYLPTRGRPIEVLQEGLDLVCRRFGGRLEVLGAGTTGSGRHLAAGLIGADVVHNEITSQMVSALHFAPQTDTIFEIGGQDSKYIAIRDGRLADFEMNKICAGGTGSFLEEQAERLGIDIIGEFAALALDAAAPCDLGARCTVFMDTEVVRAQSRGATLADLCAGLAYSVARNYLEKVVGGRPIGGRILFQGGTASNAAVVEAFRRLLGRDVVVHPYNRISGAIGAALLAARAGLARSAFVGLDACVGSTQRSFTCHRCENRCQVNRIQAGARVMHFGDVCERYASRDREVARAPRPFDELFARREQLMERALATVRRGEDGMPRMGLLRASLNLEFLPFWTVFLRELDYEPVVSGKSTSELLQQHAGGLPAELCLPIKTAAGQARALLSAGTVDRVFMPAVLECPARAEEARRHTCLYSQQLPDLLRLELGDRVVTCQFSLGHGLLSLVEPMLALGDALARPVDAVARALRKAEAAQLAFTSERRRLGEDALASGFDRAIVVLGRPYNTHDPFLNLALAHHLDRLQLPAIPWDLLPLDDVRLDARWDTVPWHYSREQLRAIELMRADPRLFPLLVSSYGCGPDGFVVKHIEALLADRPRLLLEFDEHRGEAGLVTRLEAFADEIAEHVDRSRQATLAKAPRQVTPERRQRPAGRRFFVPDFSRHAAVYAAVLRGAGYEASVLRAPDHETVRLGEQIASGRECHPYAVLAGELACLVREVHVGQGDVFLFPNCEEPCLLNQYGDSCRMALAPLHSPVEVWEATTAQLAEIVGYTALMSLYEGLLATDVLMVLGSRIRPYQRNRDRYEREIERALGQVAGAVEARTAVGSVLAEAAAALWSLPRDGAPGDRPVVGITGDVYSRMNLLGNADLFLRLERMGIEVWPSPYYATMNDLSSALDLHRAATKGRVATAAVDYLSATLAKRIGRRLAQLLPAGVAAWAMEPPADALIELARPYVGPRTSHMVVLVAAKLVDFLRRGAAGAINATAINCMVGTATAALVPAIRAAHDQAPIITLVYGAAEAPSQRIRLETFAEQVHARARTASAIRLRASG